MNRSKSHLSPGCQKFLAAILDEPDHAGAAAFAASILGEETGYPDEPRDRRGRRIRGRPKPPLSPGYQAFLAAILDEPDHAGAAAFAASILGEDTGYPNEPCDEKGRRATGGSQPSTPSARDVFIAAVLREHNYNPNEPRDERGRWTTGGPHEAWVQAVMRGGPVSPEISGDIDAARNLFMNAAMRHARAGSAGPLDDLVVKPGDVFRPQNMPFFDKPGDTYSPIPLRTGAEISVAFRSAKERGFRGAKGDNPTDIDSPVLSMATPEPPLGGSSGDRPVPIAYGGAAGAADSPGQAAPAAPPQPHTPPVMMPPGVLPPTISLPITAMKFIVDKVGSSLIDALRPGALLDTIKNAGVQSQGEVQDFGWRGFGTWPNMDEDLDKWCKGLVGTQVDDGWAISHVDTPQPWLRYWVRNRDPGKPDDVQIDVKVEIRVGVDAQGKDPSTGKPVTASGTRSYFVKMLHVTVPPDSLRYQYFQNVRPAK